MRFVPSFCRATGMALIWAILCGACTHGAPAATSPTGAGDAAPPKAVLPPEIEAKLKGFVDKAKVEKEKVWNIRMDKEIESVVQTTGLDAERSKTLEAPAKQAVESSLDGWGAKMSDQFRVQLATMTSDQASKVVDQWQGQAAAYASQDFLADLTAPYEQPDWIKALHQTLTPEQAATWDKAQADHKDKIEKEVANAVKMGATRVNAQQMQEILAECGSIERALNLSKDRTDKLEALGKTVVDQTTEMFRKRTEKIFFAMQDNQRDQFARNPNMSFGIDTEETPTEQASWKAGLAGILTPEEVTRLQAARDALKAKRVHVMGQLMVTLLDEKLAFTDAQRQKFGPIADRLAKDMPNLFPDNQENMYYSFQPDQFYTSAAKATDAEIKPILDDIQFKRWQQLSHPDAPATDGAAADKSKSDEIVEPEDVEKAISNFLYAKAQDEKKHSLDENVLKAEDAVRVAGLGAETAARLETAARGTTEQYLLGWKWMMDQQIRSQLQGVTSRDIKQRLDNLQNMFFQRNMGTTASTNIWGETVKTELNAQQQAAWQKVTDARTAFHDQTVTALVMMAFDLKVQLSDDQRAKLEPIVTGVIRDYGPDIAPMFSGGNNVPWYMTSQFELVPFAGVDEKDLKAILSKDQMTRWSGNQDATNATQWWQNIEQMHKQRVPKK